MMTVIQKLREETGAGVMDCKKALEEAGGDYILAKQLIEKQGLAKAAKKAERETGAGLLESYIHNGRVGVLLELRTETDFVGRSEPVKALAHNLALHIAAMGPETVEDLLKQPYVKDESKNVEELIKGVIAVVGENLKVARFARYQI
ncbi:MAG: translation elongation factor Ts [Candidatus Harrisonbacteria bacterium]|nr:translation elongation factor Ts [Candidatus Harrisonbacteria bacterium]